MVTETFLQLKESEIKDLGGFSNQVSTERIIVLMYLKFHANKKTRLVTISNLRIAKETGISENKVRVILKYLIEMDFIKFSKKIKRVNTYLIVSLTNFPSENYIKKIYKPSNEKEKVKREIREAKKEEEEEFDSILPSSYN